MKIHVGVVSVLLCNVIAANANHRTTPNLREQQIHDRHKEQLASPQKTEKENTAQENREQKEGSLSTPVINRSRLLGKNVATSVLAAKALGISIKQLDQLITFGIVNLIGEGIVHQFRPSSCSVTTTAATSAAGTSALWLALSACFLKQTAYKDALEILASNFVARLWRLSGARANSPKNYPRTIAGNKAHSVLSTKSGESA